MDEKKNESSGWKSQQEFRNYTKQQQHKQTLKQSDILYTIQIYITAELNRNKNHLL